MDGSAESATARNWLCIVIALVMMAGVANGQETELAFEVIVDGLDNPRGIAIQPDTGDIYIADSGQSRIVRVVGEDIVDVITDFPVDYTGKNPIYKIGPLGLLFLDREQLLVGGGGSNPGTDQIYVFEVPDRKPGRNAKPRTAQDHLKASLTMPAEGTNQPNGNFWSLAKFDDQVFATTGEDADNGWIVSFSASETDAGLKRFFATMEANKVQGPAGIAISPEGEIVVTQTGSTRGVNDSLLSFYDMDGQFLDKFDTGLKDVIAIAYGPNRGRLFALDLNQSNPNLGGLYKLVATRNGCKPVELARLNRPTAMAFAPNGDLYVTTIGRFVQGSDDSNGQLLKFPGIDREVDER